MNTSKLDVILGRDNSRPEYHKTFLIDLDQQEWTAATDGKRIAAVRGRLTENINYLTNSKQAKEYLTPDGSGRKASMAELKTFLGETCKRCQDHGWTPCSCRVKGNPGEQAYTLRSGEKRTRECPLCSSSIELGWKECSLCKNDYPGVWIGPAAFDKRLLRGLLATASDIATILVQESAAELEVMRLSVPEWRAAIMPRRESKNHPETGKPLPVFHWGKST